LVGIGTFASGYSLEALLAATVAMAGTFYDMELDFLTGAFISNSNQGIFVDPRASSDRDTCAEWITRLMYE
jgi:hypothetical protein